MNSLVVIALTVAAVSAQILLPPKLGCTNVKCADGFISTNVNFFAQFCPAGTIKYDDTRCCQKCVEAQVICTCPAAPSCPAGQKLVRDLSDISILPFPLPQPLPEQKGKRQVDVEGEAKISCQTCPKYKCVADDSTCTCQTAADCGPDEQFVRNLIITPTLPVNPLPVDPSPFNPLPEGKNKRQLQLAERACNCEGRCIAKCQPCPAYTPPIAGCPDGSVWGPVSLFGGIDSPLLPDAFYCNRACPKYACNKLPTCPEPECPPQPLVLPKCPVNFVWSEDVSTVKVGGTVFAPSAPPQNGNGKRDVKLSIACPEKKCLRPGCVPVQQCSPCVVPGAQPQCPEGETFGAVYATADGSKPTDGTADKPITTGFVGFDGKLIVPAATDAERANNGKRQSPTVMAGFDATGEVTASDKLIASGLFPVVGCPRCPIYKCHKPPTPKPVCGLTWLTDANCVAAKKCEQAGNKWYPLAVANTQPGKAEAGKAEAGTAERAGGKRQVDLKLSLLPTCRGCPPGVCLAPPKPLPVCKCAPIDCPTKQFFVPDVSQGQKPSADFDQELQVFVDAKKAFVDAKTSFEASAKQERKRQFEIDGSANAELKLAPVPADLDVDVRPCLCPVGKCIDVEPPVFCTNAKQCLWDAKRCEAKLGKLVKPNSDNEKALFVRTCGCPTCTFVNIISVKVAADVTAETLATSLAKTLGDSKSIKVTGKDGRFDIEVTSNTKAVEGDDEAADEVTEAQLKQDVLANSLVEEVDPVVEETGSSGSLMALAAAVPTLAILLAAF